MKKILLFVLAGVTALTLSAKDKKATAAADAFHYDVEYVKTTGDGIAQVKVGSYAKKANVATSEIRKDAVHAVIFKGYAGTGAGVRPLAKDPDVQFTKADFFNQFFGGNDWERYVSDVQTGSMEAMKVGKEYKGSATVSVNVKLLRQHLEKAGVIRGLASGF